MKMFVVAILCATIIGGFVGGEITGRLFTLTGAVIGGAGLAAVLLGLGAFFSSQEDKRRNRDLPPEVRGVFDRMLENDTDQRAVAQVAPEGVSSAAAKSKIDREAVFLSTVAQLVAIQLLPKYASPKEAFPALMTSKRAAGYLFGFHDALMQKLGLFDLRQVDEAIALMERSYKILFGQQAGNALHFASLHSQEDQDFSQGVMLGGTDLANYVDNKVPPLGLGRMLILGAKA